MSMFHVVIVLSTAGTPSLHFINGGDADATPPTAGRRRYLPVLKCLRYPSGMPVFAMIDAQAMASSNAS